ncbi:hypothetical protein IY145_23590 [Methylosinus sp. H3A]|uniref:hypothetical protein n=1 Tax=Methylosinus sp. H3A TaxID=2785786 RepID=UPI0018C2C272|nr:hypothetical protein [Methylosinus sp. H3A]MBG0812333.1 hypothetical protein [Methylosinus sp. H3A]
MSLTQNQIDEITAARDQALATGGTSGATIYYSAIAHYFPYGNLAASVQNPTSWASIVANTYAQNKLVHDLGLTYSAANQEAIRLDLINRDYAARTQAGWNDITPSDIANYHSLTFSLTYFGNPHAQEAWTPYNIIETLGSNYDWMTATLTHYAETYLAMIGHQLFGNPADANYGSAFDWVQDMRVGYVIDWRNYTFVKGDGVWATAATQYIGDHAVTPITNLIVPISSAGASADNPFYSDAIEGVLLDAVMTSSDPGVLAPFVSDRGGSIAVDIAAASAAASSDAGWLSTMLTGEKLAAIGTFDQANWNLLQNDPGYAEAFSLIDAFGPDQFVFQTTGASVAADLSGRSAVLGGANSGEFFAGDNGSLILSGGGSDRIHDGASQDFLFGGAGADYISTAVGGDIIDGGTGNDVIDATQVPQNWNNDGTLVDGATVLLRRGSGHDYVQVATQSGGLGGSATVSGINTIEFDGVTSDDVTLYWDAALTNTSGVPGSSYYSETWKGNAALVLKDTGDSIFIGPVTGSDIDMNGVAYHGIGSDTGFIQLAFQDQTLVDWSLLFTINHNITLGALPSVFSSAPSDYVAGSLIS